MSKFDWRNGFAVGLTLGLAGAVLIGLALETFPSEEARPNAQGNEAKNVTPEDKRWWLIGRIVYMDDTAAQWLMAFLTLVAVVLIWKTLVATRDMVKDTREIGDQQLEAIKREVALTHPPRFKITRPILHSQPGEFGQMPDFSPGETIYCRCFLMNYGRYAATVTMDDKAGKLSIEAYLYFAKEGLIPMHEASRRYWNFDAWSSPNGVTADSPMVEPGTVTHYWDLTAEIPIWFNFDNGDHLYIVGLVRYLGAAEDARGYYFCKRYLPDEQRFEDAEEYENED